MAQREATNRELMAHLGSLPNYGKVDIYNLLSRSPEQTFFRSVFHEMSVFWEY